MGTSFESLELQRSMKLESLLLQYFSHRQDMLEYISSPSVSVDYALLVNQFAQVKLELKTFLLVELRCSYVSLKDNVIFTRGSFTYEHNVD